MPWVGRGGASSCTILKRAAMGAKGGREGGRKEAGMVTLFEYLYFEFEFDLSRRKERWKEWWVHP